jgi:carbon monoxide dehydrogenase subunit G
MTVAEVSVTAEFDAPSERLWQVVADFGNVAWIPGMTDVRVEGQGPGMTRFLPAGDVEIHERLESVDEQNRSIVYTIPKNIPMPISDYRATMKVEDSGSGSRLIWSCTLEPQGVSEGEAKEIVRGMYDMMAGWIRDYLAQS